MVPSRVLAVNSNIITAHFAANRPMPCGECVLQYTQELRRMFIHELSDWPRFNWSQERIAEPLVAISRQQGRLLGHMEALGFNLRQEATLQVLTEDVLKTSEIEGERLDVEEVRSSIARRLGIDMCPLKPADRN